jgi:hypothetical protein
MRQLLHLTDHYAEIEVGIIGYLTAIFRALFLRRIHHARFNVLGLSPLGLNNTTSCWGQ